MKKRFFILCLVFCNGIVLSQDGFFSQYTTSRLSTNPAFAGTDSALVLSGGYRYQWPNISGGYQTYYFSADQYVKRMHGGIGINYLHDNEMNGILKKTSAGFIYSGHISLFKNKLIVRPALQISYFQNKFDFSLLNFGDQIDARRGFVYNTNELTNFNTRYGTDISAGLLLYTKRYYGGIALYHLNQPDEGIMGVSVLPMKISFMAGANLNFKTIPKITFSPNVLLVKQNDFQMFVPSLLMEYKHILIGGSYRTSDAAIATVGYKNKHLRVSYSFDYTTSNLTIKNTYGSHEVQVLYYLNYQKKKLDKVLRLL